MKMNRATVVSVTSILIGAAVWCGEAPSLDAQVERHIADLQSSDFRARENATKSLLTIGRPAAPRLYEVSIDRNGNLEAKRRAQQLLEEIAPWYVKWIEDKDPRDEARRSIEKRQGINASQWGIDISNPFLFIPADDRHKLSQHGVDLAHLASLRAVLINQTIGGSCSREIVNCDPKTVLVLGKSFRSNDCVYSLGPVVLLETSDSGRCVLCSNLVWAQNNADFSSVQGFPVLIDTREEYLDPMRNVKHVYDDFGWKMPPSLFSLPQKAAMAGFIPKFEEKRIAIDREIASYSEPLRAADVSVDAPNPFKSVTTEGVKRLEFRGIDVNRLKDLKSIKIRPTRESQSGRDILNDDPDTVLTIDGRFGTRGRILSRGPVVLADSAWAEEVICSNLAWFSGRSKSLERIVGLPVILSERQSVFSHIQIVPDLWHGNYGLE